MHAGQANQATLLENFTGDKVEVATAMTMTMTMNDKLMRRILSQDFNAFTKVEFDVIPIICRTQNKEKKST